MWRFQLLDETHMLIKFGCREGVVGKMSDYAQHTSLFALYDVSSTRTVGWCLR